MQKLTLFFLSACVILFSSAEKPARDSRQIRWMTLNEAATQLQHAKKPVLIDLYTDWCGWCKVMDQKTFTNENLIQYVEEKFYPVKINAESKDAILWKGKTYQFNRNYRVNDFTMYVTQGRLEFPTTVVIPSDGTDPQAIPGYLETKDFELIAKYFGEGGYGNIPFEKFQKEFKPSW